MQIDRKDIGYTVYSRLEEALRSSLRENLSKFGDEWAEHIPTGIWDKVGEKSSLASYQKADDPADMLEETNIPDLAEIVCYKNAFSVFIPHGTLTQRKFKDCMNSLYELRCKIAHVKRSFTAIDLDLLIEISESFLPVLGVHGNELRETLECIRTNPDSVVIHIPPDFFLDGVVTSPCLQNLPPSDYDPDGGFIGRKNDLKKIKSLVLGDLDRVVTISGAGGVGKTALAHRFCTSIAQDETIRFDAIMWISAKEEKLTLTGIKPIEPSFRNYEEVLDKILEVYNWYDILQQDLSQKEQYVDLILRESDKGILLVVDNLETIQDERILEFIKDFPRPNKVLITSRMGLGEVERRYVLKEMSAADSIALIRIVAREKGADSLVKMPDEILQKYAERMSRYPLAIKWVIGQVALGKDIEQLVDSLTCTSADITRFCFQHIFDKLLSDNSRMILYCLAASDVPLTRGVLTHVSGLQTEELDKALRALSLASLVIPENKKSDDETIVTSYALLPLTLGYLKTKLQSQPDLSRTIKARAEATRNSAEEARRAGRQYRYALQDLGATSDEEMIAASWALTAYHRSQIGDYAGAMQAFKRAVEIAPNFSRVYRNWAVVESSEAHYETANELMGKATKLTPNDASLWFVWGNIEKRRGRLEHARRCFEKALVLSPRDGAVLGGLGEVEKRSGNYQDAAGYFQKALAVPCDLQGYKHMVVTYTAFADNQSRWSQMLWKDRKHDEALAKAKEAYDYAHQAVRMAKGDIRAQDTRREASYQVAWILANIEGVDAALPFFNEAISKYPKRIKEKKMTSNACYYLSSMLLYACRREEAEHYFRMGEKALMFRVSKDRDRYNSLRAELLEPRFSGKLVRVFRDKGYGFIERDDTPGQSLFVHVTQMFRDTSNEEFERMEGSRVSFTLKETKKGLSAQNVVVLDDQ